MFVVLDAGPLGQLAHPEGGPLADGVQEWAREIEQRGDELVVPEIADYEVRRELLRAGRSVSVRRLDVLAMALRYEPLSTAQLQTAAQLWADARNRGRPTAHDHALDGDAILAAQARHLGDDAVVATTNSTHLSRYVDARHWRDV